MTAPVEPTTMITHAALPNLRAYVQYFQGKYLAGIRNGNDMNVRWFEVPSMDEGISIVTDMLENFASQLPNAAIYPPGTGIKEFVRKDEAAAMRAAQAQQAQVRETVMRKEARKAAFAEARSEMKSDFKAWRARKALNRDCQRYPCPDCRAGKWQGCVSIHGNNRLPEPHVSRIEQYQRKHPNGY